MKEMLDIYIDHYGLQEHKDAIFAQKLRERITSIKERFTIRTYADLEIFSFDGMKETMEAIEEADIIIPVITADYLGFASLVDNIFNNIIQSRDKYLFPILYTTANWETFSWIVKSKMIPEDGIPLSEYSDNEADKVINELINKIAEIVKSKKTKDVSSLKQQHALNNIGFVFISHDHEDGDFAELLKLQLEKNGIISWIDNERLKIGQDWREEIDDGITNSIAIIAIMTPEARRSEYVTYEWAFAWGKGKKIFPIMLKQTQLHPRLESLQYLDFTKRNSRPFDELINSIKELINN